MDRLPKDVPHEDGKTGNRFIVVEWAVNPNGEVVPELAYGPFDDVAKARRFRDELVDLMGSDPGQSHSVLRMRDGNWVGRQVSATLRQYKDQLSSGTRAMEKRIVHGELRPDDPEGTQ